MFSLPGAAQNLRDADQPAEFPPESFTGKQYVDSKGCVFIRAGFDGNVAWVPRVNRQRKVVCGFEPTFAKAEPPAEPAAAAVVVAAPAPEPAPEVVVPVAPKSPPKPVVAASAPAPKVRPKPVVVASPAPVKPAPVVTTKPVAASCSGLSAVSAGYLKSGSGHSVRCGPQGDHPGGYATASVAAPGFGAAPAPKISPPPGYKPAFEDGRLNPHRGQGTAAGNAQMHLVWTTKVPRKLIDQNTGRNVTGLFPGLRFPFISMKQQTAYVAKHGWPASSGQVAVISTKNVPTPEVSVAPSNGHRYVQVGAYGQGEHAQKAARMLQRLGLPARIAVYRKGGVKYQAVQAGPFASAAQLQAALSAARRAGFSQAYTRK